MFLWLKTSAPFSPLACLFLPQPIFTSVIMNFFNTFTTIQNNSLLNDLFVIIIILNYYNNNNYKINVEGKSTSLMDQHEFYAVFWRRGEAYTGPASLSTAAPTNVF